MSEPRVSGTERKADMERPRPPLLRRHRDMGHPGPQIRGPKRTLRLIGDAFLWTAAIAGLICIALVIAAQIFNLSLIMFKTGSMSPTIPAGSVALVQEISASEVKSGDIITVDRPGDLPVTHRVISVEPIDNGQWRVEMKGDANVQPDPLPYDVVEVRQTMGHLPDLATVIVSLGSPWVLGGMTLGAAGLVTWAFWPRSQRTGTKG